MNNKLKISSIEKRYKQDENGSPMLNTEGEKIHFYVGIILGDPTTVVSKSGNMRLDIPRVSLPLPDKLKSVVEQNPEAIKAMQLEGVLARVKLDSPRTFTPEGGEPMEITHEWSIVKPSEAPATE